MGSGLQIVVSNEQGRVPVTIFHLSGDIDANTYEQLQKQAEETAGAGTQYLLLDLSKVNYMSSAGLRTLHTIFTMLRTVTPDDTEQARSKGIRDGTYKSPHLKLLNPSANVLQVLKTTGFDMYLEIHRDLQEAVASF